MSEWAIQAKGVCRNFAQVQAVRDLDLKVAKGSIYGFLGPNGSGKTTAIRMLTGLLRPTSGSVDVLGYSLPKQAETLRLHIGYMTQKFSLYDDLTLHENLDFMASIYGIRGNTKRNRIEELLELYGLRSLVDQRAGQMSGGQRQRVALAAATLHRPELLFLDEPTSAVDPENRRDFWEQLFDLSEQGTTILVSTHYMDEAERCHQLAILEEGIKRADGTPEHLLASIGVRVIELSGNDLRQLKQQLMQLRQVVSAAQLGARLRVLVKEEVADPIPFLQKSGVTSEMVEVRPNLEDLFVMSTQGRNR